METAQRKVVVEILAEQPADPKGKRDAQVARGLARRGYDIIAFAHRAWPICTFCDLPCWISQGGRPYDNQSTCCDRPVRIHGWSL